MSIALQFLRNRAVNDWKNLRLSVTPRNKKKFLEGIDQLEVKGFKVLPSCENHNKDGTCKGHKKETPAGFRK